MATALADLPPTPTSLSLIRAEIPIDSTPDPTRQESVAPLDQHVSPAFDTSERFHPLHVHGSGGQGQVFVAWDDQLRRDVAVKVLKPKHAARPINRARFLREAEIAGGLEHPGVVPVYALGEQADGRPYYAMRLINGRTLHEVIRDFHRPEQPRTEAERNVLFRQLLQRFISVCQTIAFAHARGIVHRDIKPSNVLIGSYGEAVVVDWGLARPYDAATGCAADTDEFPSHPQSGIAASDSTQMGAAIGTPAFMSPEQAEGRWDLVGPCSDIYALGATLYVLISGALPLCDLPWTEMSRRIRLGDIPSARRVNGLVPKPLDAICRKAMATDPAARYETASALAADLEHWLADEPVAACRDPLLDRARRWVRRHKTFVAAAAVLWSSLAIALGIGLVAVDRERQHTEVARRMTRAALERTTSKVIDQWLFQQRELRPEHRVFLNEVLDSYLAFTRERPNDPDGRLGVIRAYCRVAEIRHKLGQSHESIDPVNQAREMAEQFHREFPQSFDGREELARTYYVLGILAKDGQKSAEAEDYFTRAVRLQEANLEAKPEDRAARLALAGNYNNRAGVLMALKRPAEATEAFRASLQLWKLVCGMEDASAEDRQHLAVAHGNLAACLLSQQQYVEAEVEFRAAIDLCTKLEAQSPGDRGITEALASSTRKLATLLLTRNRCEEARLWLTQAAVQYERLCVWYPSLSENFHEAAGIRCNLGAFELKAGAAEAALGQYDRVLAQLTADGRKPKAREHAILKAAHAGRAESLDKLQRHAEAVAAWNSVAALAPEQRLVFETCRAMQLLKAGRSAEALSEVDRLIALRDAPAEVLYNCACIYTRADSEQGRAKAVELLQRLAATDYFKKPGATKHLDEDRDLTALHDRADYQRFRARLGK